MIDIETLQKLPENTAIPVKLSFTDNTEEVAILQVLSDYWKTAHLLFINHSIIDTVFASKSTMDRNKTFGKQYVVRVYSKDLNKMLKNPSLLSSDISKFEIM